jgi:DNA-binding IclR family transcriptional regulator
MAETAPHSQTLDRGIRVLELLAEADGPLSIAELSGALDVHRSIAYRILRTLEDHGLVTRDAAGRVALGSRLAALARSVARDLQSAALPELTAVANELGMTAFLVVLDRRECVTLLSVEPRHAVAAVAQRPGTRHPLNSGAPGVAIQSSLSDADWAALAPGVRPRPEASAARAAGFATSHDEVIPGLSAVAVPLRIAGQAPAALAVVYVATGRPVEELAARLAEAAASVAGELQ